MFSIISILFACQNANCSVVQKISGNTHLKLCLTFSWHTLKEIKPCRPRRELLLFDMRLTTNRSQMEYFQPLALRV